ncbi:MAG: glycosyltransferase family 2 protein [Acidobacteria bacterium]|nr:glycosyltransferase family 2 protein [Acidobacteriota bacterium]
MPGVIETAAYDVVIVAFNDAETLPACLVAVKGLDPQPPRLVVVDNASQDDSADIARRAGAEVLSLKENTGFAGGMNRGIEYTNAPWVLLLNPDCAPHPDFFSELLQAIDARPQAEEIGSATGLLMRACGAELSPTGTVDAAGMVVTPAGRHFDRAAGEPGEAAPNELAWVFGGTGAATLFRRRALDDVAYPDGQIFPESFFCYREDAELAWRLQHRGWRCLYVPTAKALHQRGFRPEGGRHGQAWINRHSVKNRFLLRAHCANLRWHLRCFPFWLIRDLLVLVACLTVEISSFPGLIEAWRLRRDATARRRWVLSRTKVPSRQVSRWFRRPSGRVDMVNQ